MAGSAFLAAGVRSPIGRFGEALASLRATEVASQAASSLLARAAVPTTAIQRVVAGMVLQDMTESNPARIVAQRIGISPSVGAFTVNMQCCSGMLAFILASQQVSAGEIDCALVLGLESMSNAPHMVHGARWGLRHAHAQFVDTFKECTLAGSKMWGDPRDMIDVAENHAKVDGICREEMDAYALMSHRRAIDAADGGRLADEIVPIEVPAARRGPSMLTQDEHPRRGLELADLARLSAVRPGGVITAGNAAGINDGAAAALIANQRGLAAYGLAPLARVVPQGTAILGCDPQLMGYSCVDALDAALRSAQLGLDDLDLIECNEGFAVQLVACQRRAKWPAERLNVDGGAIGLGHPVGMSGLRIVIHLAHALRQRDLRRGGATVPAGSGLGTAVLLERV